jgi:hypothetical protein
MLQIIIFLFFIIQTSCHCYLNNLQISYIRNILTNPRTPDDIRSKTKQILFHEWVILCGYIMFLFLVFSMFLFF